MNSYRLILTVVLGCLGGMGGCGDDPPVNGPGGSGGRGGMAGPGRSGGTGGMAERASPEDRFKVLIVHCGV